MFGKRSKRIISVFLILNILVILLLRLVLLNSSDSQLLPTIMPMPTSVAAEPTLARDPIESITTQEQAVEEPQVDINEDSESPQPTDTPTALPLATNPPTENVLSTPDISLDQPTSLPTVEPRAILISSEKVENQIVIRFSENASLQERADYIQKIGGTVNQSIDALDTVIVNVPDGVVELPASSIVAESEPDYYVSALLNIDIPTSDPYFDDQWALPVIGAPEAWQELPDDAEQVTVAVIDSGICLNHPDLVGRILDNGYDFVEDDDTPQDELGHGCGVAGIIAANIDNGIGIAGVAPNAQILPVRVLDANGLGTYSDVAAGIVYAVDEGAQIINLSLGGANPSNTLNNAVDYAIAHDVTVVAAAGNTGGSVLYPAAYEPVIAVGSVDPDLEMSSFSSRGPEIDVLAPGRDILTTANNGGYATMSGTSFSAPHISGNGLLLSKSQKNTININTILNEDSVSNSKTSIDFNSIVFVPQNLEEPIWLAVENSSNFVFAENYLVTVFRFSDDNEWGHVVIMPSHIIESGWDSFSEELVIEVLLAKADDETWTGHLFESQDFESISQQVPSNFIDFAPKVSSLASNNYEFPWIYNEQWALTSSWHPPTSNNLDFNVRDGATDAILTSASGNIGYYCGPDSAGEVWLRLTDDDNRNTVYGHLLWRSELSSVIGQWVEQGTLLGSRHPNLPTQQTQGRCGYGTAPHLHMILPTRDISFYDLNSNTYVPANNLVQWQRYRSNNNGGSSPNNCENVSYDGIILYSQQQCNGSSRQYNSTGFRNLTDEGFNDSTWSIFLGGNWSARIWDDTDRGGSTTCINGWKWDLTQDNYDDGDPIIDNGNATISSIEVFQGTSCSTPPPNCPINADQVALYVGTGYSGQCVVKGVGEYPNPGSIGLPNDSISSLRVGVNVKATLCNNDNFDDCETFTDDDDNLTNNGIGTSTSSAKVEWENINPNAVEVCTTDNASSGCHSYNNPGLYQLGDAGLNDVVRSVLVPSGRSIFVFRAGDYSSSAQCYSSNRIPLPDSAPDNLRGEVSSIQVFNNSNCPISELQTVVMFDSQGFGGYHWGVGRNPGLINMSDIEQGNTWFNDQAESMKIPNGWSVRVFNGSNGNAEGYSTPCVTGEVQDFNANNWNLNNRISSVEIFHNSSCTSPDSTPPTGSITSPQDGSHHNMPVPIRVTASDDSSGVNRVEFYGWSIESWSNQEWIPLGVDSTAPYELDWDNRSIPDGQIYIAALIVDNAGNDWFLQGAGQWVSFILDKTPPTNQNLARNGDFAGGFAEWLTWGDIDIALVSEVLHFKHRSDGTEGVAALHQDLNYTAPAGAPFEIQLDLGNNSPVAKELRVSLRHYQDWNESFTCTFMIPAHTPLTTYTVRGMTAVEWPNVRFEVQVDPSDGIPDALMDNVSVIYNPNLSLQSTECIDAYPIPVYVYNSFESDDLNMYVIEGQNVALLVPSLDYSLATLTNMVSVFDDVYDYYAGITGREPSPLYTYNGLATLAVVPSTCGAGCGYLGLTGIEFSEFHFNDVMYPGVFNNQEYDQAPFYEFGRNFWFYGDQIEYEGTDDTGSITTGFAVFMRFMAIDSVAVTPGPFNGNDFAVFRSEVEGLLQTYLADTTLNWDNTLRIGVAPANSLGLGSADLFASFMFELHNLYGDTFVETIWKEVDNRPIATSTQMAVDNFIIAASISAGENLQPLFVEQWRWPISTTAIQELNSLFGIAPSNDDFASATNITSLPFTDSIHTQGATEAVDDHSSPNCGSLLALNTVWYQYTPSVDTIIEVDTVGSDYDTMLHLLTGTQGDLTEIECNDDIGVSEVEYLYTSRLVADLNAGTTYYLMVSEYDGETNGGQLELSIELYPVNVNLISNGDFSNGLTDWYQWSDIDASVNNDVLEISHQAGSTEGAAIFQDVLHGALAGWGYELTLDLGNNSNVSKLVTVSFRYSNDDPWDTAISCAFNLPPNAPLRPYAVKGFTNADWSNIRVELNPNPADGISAVLADNISLTYKPNMISPATRCQGPDAPIGENLVINSDFALGEQNWDFWGDIDHQPFNGTLRFHRTTPIVEDGASVFQFLDYTAPVDSMYEISVDLVNDSGSPKTATVVMRHIDTWENNILCTFDVPADTIWRTYTVQGTALTEWPLIIFEVLPWPADNLPSLVMDNVSVQRRTDLVLSGTNCISPVVRDISGVVRDDQSQPLQSVLVMLEDTLTNGATVSQSACTDINGAYGFSNLSSLEYQVTAGGPNSSATCGDASVDNYGSSTVSPIDLINQISVTQDFTLIQNTPPSQPVISAPSGIVTDASPDVVWANTNDATSYRVWARTISPYSKVFDQTFDTNSICDATTCQVTMTPELLADDYAVFVIGHNANGWGSWSNGSNFTVSVYSAVPSQPLISAPVGIVTDASPDVVWANANDATSYRVWVRTISPYSKVFDQTFDANTICDPTTCQATLSPDLLADDYAVFIRPENPLGWGPWSTGSNFTVSVYSDVPSQPIISAPSGVVTDTSPDVVWANANDAASYRVWVRTISPYSKVFDQTFDANTICDPTTCQATLSPDLVADDYAVFIRPQNPLGWGPWSTGSNFTVSIYSDVPAQPVISAPVGTINDPSPDVVWANANDATNYRVWARTISPYSKVFDTTFDANTICDPTTCQVTMTPDLLADDYAVFIRPQNPLGWGPWSAGSEFTIDPLALALGDDSGIGSAGLDSIDAVDSVDDCSNVPNPDQIDADESECEIVPIETLIPISPTLISEPDTDEDAPVDDCSVDDSACEVIPTETPTSELDSDGDGVTDTMDNCPDMPNPDQADDNGNGVGNACEVAPTETPTSVPPSTTPKPDSDGDGVADSVDNCSDVPNLDQADDNGNGVGNACEVAPTETQAPETTSEPDGGESDD